jgi:Domain of unknown function (DUF389)
MLHLRVFGAAPVMERVAESVAALPGAQHVTRTDAGNGAGDALVNADVDPASAAVGVAISVTTIPASAYVGVAAGLGEVGKASGALAVLATNVAMLMVGGSLTLPAQEAITRRRPA